MPKLFAASIALFLFLSAGYGLTQAARSIPWDCADWQAFAYSDRTTAILESLAENRGKTLYCGLDQSDTFAKAETWAAGKDRNERDDTVYYGERGQFRGFIAAQEGWLTEGESGITGQSIATIFEFPKEERRGRRIKYVPLGDVNGRVTSCGLGVSVANCGDRKVAIPSGGSIQQNIEAALRTFNQDVQQQLDWMAIARQDAHAKCRDLHQTPHIRRVSITTDVAPATASGFGVPTDSRFQIDGTTHVYQERPWTATCVKKKKGSRRR